MLIRFPVVLLICCSHSVWATMEIRTSSIREESDVEKGDGLASLC